MAIPLPPNDYTNGMLVLDYDTIKQDGVRKRIEGLYAPEVQQLGGDTLGEIKPGQPGGQLAAAQVKDLIDAGGFYNVIDKDKTDNNGRPLVRLTNNDGEDFTDKSYLEGIITPNEFTDERGRQLYKQGEVARALAASRGDVEDENDPWVTARNQRIQADISNVEQREAKGLPIGKIKPLDEKEFGAAQSIYGDYNPYSKSNPLFHIPGARYDGSAISVLDTSWQQGWNGIGEGIDGLFSTYYDLIGDEGNWAISEERARANIQENRDKTPYFIDRIGNVKDLNTFGDYVVGLLGQSAPYLISIAGSAATASLLAPAAVPAMAVTAAGALPMALVYAGQTYNDMEGSTMADKDASTAISVGAGMAALDMLGFKGLMSGTDVIRKGAKEQIAKAYAEKYGVSLADSGKVVDQAFRKTTKDIATGLQGLVKFELTKSMIGKQALKDAGRGLYREGLTELGQESLGYTGSVIGSDKEFNASEFGDLALNALIGGGIAGSIISPTLSTPAAIQDYRRIKQDFEVAPDQDNLMIREIDATDVFEQKISELENTIDKENREALNLEIDKDVADYREKNKASNKGIINWMKDVGKNFVSRPLRWYYKSDMHKSLGDTEEGVLAQSLISLFSPTNEDRIAGSAVWNKENNYFGQVSMAVNDILALAAEVIGTNPNNKKGRIATTNQILKWYNDLSSGKEITPEARSLLDSIDNVATYLNKTYFDLTGENVNITAKDLFFSRNPDKKAIKKNREVVKKLLMDGNDMTADEADILLDGIINSPEGYSADKSQRRFSINDVIPANVRSRFIENPFNVPGMEEFVSKDLFDDINNVGREFIHNALVTKYIGRKGNKLKSLIAKVQLAAMKNNTWDKKFSHDIIAAAEIWMGVYNPIRSERLRGLQANATFVNLITLLGTGGPAQLPELVAAFLGRVSKSEGGNSLIEDLKKSAAKVVGHYKTSANQVMTKYYKGTGLNPSSSWTPERRRFIKSGFSGVRYGSIGQQGLDANEINASRLRASIANVFVTVSGIKPMTDVSRIISSGIANDAVFHYLDVLDTFYDPNMPMSKSIKEAYDMLAETRIPPLKTLKLYQDMKNKAVEKFGPELDWNHDDVQDFVENYGELTTLLDIARNQWIDNALANPNPSSKARIASDPHYALMFQFRGFIITFAASVLPRLFKRATSGNPNQDVQAITILAGLVAAGFLGQILKDEWKTDGRPYWLEDTEYIQRGFQASGLLGPFDFVLDAINPIYGERSIINTAQGFLGPTWGNIKQAGSVFEDVAARDWDKAQYNALKFVPILGHSTDFRKEPIQSIIKPILGEE